jgi:predicted O-methyltransferase YrrM
LDRKIVDRELESYLHRITPPRDEVASEMEEIARERGFPIVGPLVGRLFFTLARSAGARRIFEMGSGYGYSTYWFARAVGEEGRVVHTDASEENSRLARDLLGRAGLAGRVRFEVGDAREILARHEGPYDLIFCDIDKEQYPDVPELAVPRLRSGGLLLFDNMLWYGRVADAEPERESTRGVVEATRRLYGREDLVTTILPLRDGVSVSVKIAP